MHIFTPFLLLPLILWGSFIQGDSGIPPYPVKVHAQMFYHEQNPYLAIAFENEPGWHTYWKNPGDAGKPIEYKFKVGGNDLFLEETQWPVPKRFIESQDILAFGYEGEYALFFPLKKMLPQLNHKLLEIQLQWLVCKHLCIPGSATLKGVFNAESGFEQSSPSGFFWKGHLNQIWENLPQEINNFEDVEIKLHRIQGTSDENQKLQLVITMDNIPPTNDNDIKEIVKNSHLGYIFPTDYLTVGSEKHYRRENQLVLVSDIDWNGPYLEPPQYLPEDGLLDPPLALKALIYQPHLKEYQVAEVIIKHIDPTITDLSNLNPLSENGPTPVTMASSLPSGNPWSMHYFWLAVLGGLILNLMPCVLPVISLKLFALFSLKGLSQKKLILKNSIYSLGVIFTFWALYSLVYLAQQAGNLVGWGMQMQSPWFVAVMSLIIFLMGVNLLGWFEFKTPFGNKLGGIELKDTLLGDFLSGIFATILSTPCSAPFLGTALTFAFQTTPFNGFLIFSGVGLGLSLPFVMVALVPKTLHLLPKPGQWMVGLKKILGCLLILTTLWLSTILISLLTPPSKLEVHHKGKLTFHPWSEAKMQELKGKTVFIDFTAEWCLTCKVNERLVINTKGFKQLTEQYQLQLLLADWTQENEEIASFLKKQDIVGIPAYFIQKPSGELIFLGETITLKEIESILKQTKE